MSIPKIDYSDPEKVPSYLAISIDEMRSIHKKIVQCHRRFLNFYGVKPVWREIDKTIDELSDEAFIDYLDAKELQLMFLYKHIHCFVHKDLVSEFVRTYKPNAALDQQVRHLGTQLLWYVLNKGAKVPDVEEYVPSGYNYLVSIETPNPKAVSLALKRSGRLAAKSFEDLKVVYDGKCATCGIEDGKKDPRNELIVSLQQGHMNPRKALTLDNTIPQCQYCNQQYMDYFCFNEYGRIVSVNNPSILLKSPKDIQDEMLELLLTEKNKHS